MTSTAIGILALILFGVQVFCIYLCVEKGRWWSGVLGIFFAPAARLGAALPAKAK